MWGQQFLAGKGQLSIKRINPALNTWKFLPGFEREGLKAKNNWREHSVILQQQMESEDVNDPCFFKKKKTANCCY